MTNEALEAAWNELSEIQKHAASWTSEIATLVLAGPGSGKTRVLTCAIARKLEATPEEHFRILALTFTNKAADEMRSRIRVFVPGLEQRLFVGTFHSFCAEVLRQQGSHIGISPNFQIYSQQNDLQSILNDAVDASMLTSDFVSERDKKTLPVIKRLKSLLVSPELCCTDAPIEEDIKRRMAVVYPAYEAALQRHNALDFESLLLRVHDVFTRYPAIARRYRTVYKYIFIDEFQDTNYAQYQLIRAFTGTDFRKLFVVADDDQIIYQWNGASYKRIDDFRTDYTPNVVQLPVNYRCPPEIVELANRLIQHNFFRTPDKQPFQAFRASSGGDDVRLLADFSDFDTETRAVAGDIQSNHKDQLSTVAVLARNRRLLEQARQILIEEGIPAIIAQRKDQFQSTPLVWLYSCLQLANERQNRTYLEAVNGTFYQLAEIDVDVDEVISLAKAGNRDYLQHWCKLISLQLDNTSPKETIKAIIEITTRLLTEARDFQRFCPKIIEQLNELASQQPTGDPLVEIFPDYSEELDVWRDLYSEITNSFGNELTLEAFLQEMQMRSKEPVPDGNTVVLMTIHGAKGKEFPHVYLIGLVEDEMPSYQSRLKGDDSPEMEEERRNCFVAITRATETLTVSYSEEYYGWPKEPSRFLAEMGLL